MGPRALRQRGVNVVCLVFVIFWLFDSTARKMPYNRRIDDACDFGSTSSAPHVLKPRRA